MTLAPPGCHDGAVKGVEDQGPRHLRFENATQRSAWRGRRRQIEAVVAGLPAQVMDECADDLAEAVVAMLLGAAASEGGQGQDASGDLRKI